MNKAFYLLLFAMTGLLNACGGLGSSQDSVPAPSPTAFGPIGAEAAYCSAVSAPSSAVTVTSTAQFKYWVVNPSFGLTTTSTAPIRFAEVQVLDASERIIQCGETDGTGAISVAVPKVAGTYTLKVLSRADNTNFRASVLADTNSMRPYSISAGFSIAATDTTKSVALTPANYTATLEGGAFNILDQIYNANNFIRTHQTCFGGAACSSFTVAPKVRIFWQPGLSPGVYYQSPTASISFFIANDQASLGMATGIYLMGGVNGDTCVDTDHFDNSVIIHEYGHFLEKSFAYSDSPGGSHNGNSVIDPRLAWSEGWADFLQGAVRNDSHYIDTKGNASCAGGTGINVNLDLEYIVAGQDAVNNATYLGEGIFREVSVSRALWDTMTSKVGGDGFGASAGFGAIWKVFSDSVSGFRSSNVHFRNIGNFNLFMRALVSSTAPGSLADYDNLISNERQRSDLNQFGLALTPQGVGACTYDLQGVAGVNNYAQTNDFYSYSYDGNPAHSQVTLRYAAAAGGVPTDLDLYVWNESFSFQDAATLVGKSEQVYPEASGTGYEAVDLAGKPAGVYLIQVRADESSVNATARYHLETNGGTERLCP